MGRTGVAREHHTGLVLFVEADELEVKSGHAGVGEEGDGIE